MNYEMIGNCAAKDCELRGISYAGVGYALGFNIGMFYADKISLKNLRTHLRKLKTVNTFEENVSHARKAFEENVSHAERTEEIDEKEDADRAYNYFMLVYFGRMLKDAQVTTTICEETVSHAEKIGGEEVEYAYGFLMAVYLEGMLEKTRFKEYIERLNNE